VINDLNGPAGVADAATKEELDQYVADLEKLDTDYPDLWKLGEPVSVDILDNLVAGGLMVRRQDVFVELDENEEEIEGAGNQWA
jgi:hypothetical protein